MEIESWRHAWRHGFAPQFSTPALAALAEALRANSAELLQGATCDPPPLMSNADARPCGACAVGFLVAREGPATVGEIEAGFAQACFRADALLGEPTACRRFLNAFDDTPRETIFPALLAEIEAELVARATAMPVPVPVRREAS